MFNGGVCRLSNCSSVKSIFTLVSEAPRDRLPLLRRGPVECAIVQPVNR